VKLGAIGPLIVVSMALASPGTSEPIPRSGHPSCEQAATTQPEITRCAYAAAAAADQRLNQAYKELTTYLDRAEQARLLSSERAWLAFRDADCTFWGHGDFTLAATNRAYCLAELSADRAKELESWPPNAPRTALVPRN
jgi:uncharacterized protein YecT (DUF1311 family)